MHDFYRGQPHTHASWSGHQPKPLTIGIGGPVGSGKTALVDRLCKALRDTYRLAVVTNDIYTQEDAEFLCRSGALATERIIGVETGGCPHSAIREDASVNLDAIADLTRRFKDVQLIFVESGGDNLAATFSPESHSTSQSVQTKQMGSPTLSCVINGLGSRFLQVGHLKMRKR